MLKERVKGFERLVVCDGKPATLKLLRALAPHLPQDGTVKLNAPSPKSVEEGVPAIKGRVTKLSPPSVVVRVEGFDPASYRDEHRAHLQAIIKRKQQGKKIPPPATPPKEPAVTTPDLMGALEQSLAQIRAGKKAEAKPKKTPAKRKAKSTTTVKKRANA